MKKQKYIGAEIKALSNLIKRKLDDSQVKKLPECPTGSQGMIIGYVAHHRDKDIFQRDIETEFNIRRSTATGILKLMQQNGLITKESVSHDERLKKIVLTPEAIAVHEEVVQYLAEIERLLVKGLSQEDIDRFFQIVDVMKNNFLDREDASHDDEK